MESLSTQTGVPLTQLYLAIANLVEALGPKPALMDQKKWGLIKTVAIPRLARFSQEHVVPCAVALCDEEAVLRQRAARATAATAFLFSSSGFPPFSWPAVLSFYLLRVAPRAAPPACTHAC